jgi:hypothetical protein
MSNSLVRNSKRAAHTHYANILADVRTSVQAGTMFRSIKDRRRRPDLPPHFPHPRRVLRL